MLEEKEQINFFAKTNFRNKEQPFGIKVDDRRRHFYTLGKTGMGKTSMIQNMAIQDIRNGKGIAIVDPHGEFAEECLKAVPSERIKDVIYFNPADLDFPVSLNVMEKVEPEQRHLVSSGLIGIFKKLWADSWGPRLEYILRNAILALLCHPSSTLLGINRLLVDKQYREEVLSYVDDPVVSSYWIDEFSKYNERLLTEAISPIQNKVGQFLSSSLIRNIVGQTESAFSIREAMDTNKILIMNLSKGHIGEDSSALLGAMMITKIQLAAMSRVDIPEAERKDFYLYVDEFQNFATESFAGILSEARKYRLNLILAHQFMSQLDETVLDAVLGNVGSIVSFRVGALDTEILEKEFDPVFYANDSVNLDKYNIYLKLMIDGVSTRPFSATTLLPIDISDTVKNTEEVIRASRDRYAHDRIEVEQNIMNWSGMKNPEITQNIKSFAQQRAKNNNVKQSKPGQAQSESKPQQQYQRQKTVANNNEGQTQNLMRDMQIGISKEEVQAKKVFVNNNDHTDAQVIKQHKQERQIDKEIETIEKEMTVVKCSGCGKETEINFIPDGVRPVFCQDCLREYRREQSKIQQTKIDKESSGRQTQYNKQKDYGNNQGDRSSHGVDQNDGNSYKDNRKKNNSYQDNQDMGSQNANKSYLSMRQGAVKIVQNDKKNKRTKVDSEAVQNLIKNAMKK